MSALTCLSVAPRNVSSPSLTVSAGPPRSPAPRLQGVRLSCGCEKAPVPDRQAVGSRGSLVFITERLRRCAPRPPCGHARGSVLVSSADEKEESVLGSVPLLSFRVAAVQPSDNISRKHTFKVSGPSSPRPGGAGGTSPPAHGTCRWWYWGEQAVAPGLSPGCCKAHPSLAPCLRAQSGPVEMSFGDATVFPGGDFVMC